MAICRYIYRRWSLRATLVLVAGTLGLATLLLQRYAYTYVSSQRTATKAHLRRRVQLLREEGAMMSLKTAAGGTSSSSSSSSTNRTAAAAASAVKVILMHSFPWYYELSSGGRVFSSCNHSCILTLDHELVTEVDSVVIFSHHFTTQLPPPERPDQIWVYFAVESPAYSSNALFSKPEWRNRFNWTMTYRRDSDFYFGYGDFFKPASPLPVRDFTSLVAGKTKMVGWLVSHCQTQSKRSEFAAALKKYITVDIYGGCGDKQCEKTQEPSCMQMMARDYHFYLAFENSLCKDYITEKLYSLPDIVPVVRGGANYTALLPRNSFIDASLFPSVKALAEYLTKVAADKELYTSYLAWKNQWQVIQPTPFPFCQFCQRLHNVDRWARVYPNVDSWWREGVCHDPPAIVET